LSPACSKAVRQYGEVKNGHKFKRPPSRRCIARYRAIADMWLQRYSQHDVDGTIPEEVHGKFRHSKTLFIMSALARFLDIHIDTFKVRAVGGVTWAGFQWACIQSTVFEYFHTDDTLVCSVL